MTNTLFGPAQKVAVACAAGLLGAMAFVLPANAAGDGPGHAVERQYWSFGGVMGHFDRGQLQRGYKVYKEVCSACHGMRLLSFRNLGQPGGPEFSKAAVEALAADVVVIDGPNEDGEMFERPGKPADRMPTPFPNDNAARAANGGALPPDLSVMAKARSVHHGGERLHQELLRWVREVFTGYQEGGPDYLYALLTNYHDEAPAGVEIAEGMYYNAAFDGNQIAMAPPLAEGQVTYDDGTAETVENYSRDVSAFLMWAAEPHLEERKAMGLRVILYLLIMAVVLYLAKRAMWFRAH